MWLVTPGTYSLKTEVPYKLFIHKPEFQIHQKAGESSPMSAPQIIVIREQSLQTHFSPFTFFTSLFFTYFIYKRNKGVNEKFNVDKYQTNWSWDLIHTKREFAVWLWKLKQGLCINLEGWDGEGDGREVQRGGDICIPMADSCLGLTEDSKIL